MIRAPAYTVETLGELREGFGPRPRDDLAWHRAFAT